MSEPNIEPICLTDVVRIQEMPTSMDKVKRGVGETAAFAALYHESDALWVGSIFGADALQKRTGIDPWAMGALVSGAVGYVEYKFAGLARRVFEKKEDLSEKTHTVSERVRALGALAYSSFFGSANAVKINDALGLESTPRRRKVQAAAFGIGVGLWTTPTPGFEQGADAVRDYVDNMLDSPENFATYSAVTISGILEGAKIIKESRKAIGRWWNRRKEQKLVINLQTQTE